MRLKSIKLAGFKSFVDPTTVDFPTNLCAVVGPNGCGKSNIIDAVRWVMGESSAKNLRGESMTDVIFNGSSGRKPIGQASIELVFDNSDGSLIGEYASYAEISIKRRVGRDGDNQYFLNGQKCRRRDITDIFLGTGLGPRSYAIIEQGMISKLIEAKPEELRVFIEEAAGISKYKERRKETETRMRRTQENLERLSDIREELDKQLQHLHRQAQAAERYTELKKDERLYKAQLQALQWRDLDENAQFFQQHINQYELEVEEAVTKQTELDALLEQLFVENGESRESFEQIQSRYYGLGAEIARCEQSLSHQREQYNKLQEELQQSQKDMAQVQHILQEDQDKQQQWQEELIMLEPELELLTEAEEESALQLETQEQAMQQWQQTWDSFTQSASQSQQKAEIQRSQIQHIEKSMQRLDERLQRFSEETQQLQTQVSADEGESELQLEQLVELELQLDASQQQLDDQQQFIEDKRLIARELDENLDKVKTQLQADRGRLSSLEALQQAAFENNDDQVVTWLMRTGLTEQAILAEQLQVETGWEKAVEVVLTGQLQALYVDDIADYAQQALQLTSGYVTLLDSYIADYAPKNTLTPLLNKVNSDAGLQGLLAGVYVAETLEQALNARKQLSANESIITSEGLWLGSNWLRSIKDEDAQAGMLKRRHEIELLENGIIDLEAEKQRLEGDLANNASALNSAERERDELQRLYKQAVQQHNALSMQVNQHRAKSEQISHRRSQIQQDMDELREQARMEQESLAEARFVLQQAIEAIEQDTFKREDLVNQREALRDQLDHNRDKARRDKDRRYQLLVKEQSLQTQLQALQQSLMRASVQHEQLRDKQQRLQEAIASYRSPSDDASLELEALLDKRLLVEQEMSQARERVERIEQQRRDAERNRAALQQDTDQSRLKLEQARLASQTIIVQRQTLEEQLAEAEFDLQAILADMPSHANEKDWQTEIAQIAQRVARLGAINLAAIEEYKVALERKTYLDEQNDDLQQALETLENAIRKIDRETRARFKDTFEQVNAGLQELFPKVFGGGRAYLAMTGEDLLDTGIAIMAQPPGKRNSTIHLLSGGEKALTAIALVFSIFRLNPAPFCMLDEVDAPLDDANVGRYARMVEEMSAHVQFIYITHNKGAMEMAQQLLGVTMHEPGVSRIVTVNVEEAAELAAS